MELNEVQPSEASTDVRSITTRKRILTLISMASVNFSSMICYSILGPFFPVEAVKKGASQTVIGLIFGCYALCNLTGSLILGRYIVEIGAKFMLISGLFVSAGCTVLFGLLDRVPDGVYFIILSLVIRSVDALGFAAAMTSSFAVSAKVFPNNVATVLGSLEIFTGLGLIMGPPLGGWLYQSCGYEVPFMVLGGFLFLMVPFNIYILPSFDAIATKESFGGLISHPKILLICFVIFTLSSGLSSLDATLSIYATEKFGLSAGNIGIIMLGLSLPYCLASPLFGLISDRFPSTRSWFMVLGGCATALAFCLIGPVPIFNIQSQLWLMVFMLAVIGFSLGMTAIPTFPEMLTCAYEQGFDEGFCTIGLVSGLFGAFWSIGMFCGPTFGGFITQNLGFEWSAAIQGAVGFLAAFFLGVYYVFRKNRKARIVHENGIGPSDERTPLIT